MIDPAFVADGEALGQALALLLARGQIGDQAVLPMSLPDTGIGEAATLRQLAPLVLGGAQRLDGALAMAHMDPPTPWITWATTLWNAALNQNLLHPDTAPVARELEALVVNWLAPLFGMNGGHVVPGSTVANLTGIWAARDAAGAEEVVGSRGRTSRSKKPPGCLVCATAHSRWTRSVACKRTRWVTSSAPAWC